MNSAAHTSQSRQALRDHPVHTTPPVGAPYVWGRFDKNRAAATGQRTVTLDQDLFVRQVRHHKAMLDYEDLLFSRLPHLVVQYEHDLLCPETHQDCVDRICATLGLPSNPVAADLTRQAARTDVTNLADLKATLEREGLL